MRVNPKKYSACRTLNTPWHMTSQRKLSLLLGFAVQRTVLAMAPDVPLRVIDIGAWLRLMGEDAEVARNQIADYAEQLVDGGEERAGQLDASKPVTDAGDARSLALRLVQNPPLEASGVVKENAPIDALGENNKTRARRRSARRDSAVDCERRQAPI